MSSLLLEVYERYRRPFFIARPARSLPLALIGCDTSGGEVCKAIELGIPLEGVCLYPIIDFPGWGVDRPCETGLWGMANAQGH